MMFYTFHLPNLISSNTLIAAIATLISTAVNAAPLAAVDHATTNIDLNSTQYPYGAYAVSIINTFDTEIYSDDYKYIHYTFQVDFAVRNSNNSVKEVGIRYWNDSSTTTYNEASAHYNQTIGNGYELWTLFFDRGYVQRDDWAAITAQYEIAAYISYDGTDRYWDPRNNYFIYDKATQLEPVTQLDPGKAFTFIAGNDSAVVFFNGTARTYPFDLKRDLDPRTVQIQWSTDNWATVYKFEAISAPKNQWTWSIPVAKVSKHSHLPESIVYSISYKSTKGLFKVNMTYPQRIAPICRIDASFIPPKSTGIKLSGFYRDAIFCGSQFQDQDFEPPYSFRLDNEPFKQAYSHEFYTTNLTNGLHTAELRVYLRYSTDVVIAEVKVEFEVLSSVRFLEQWALDGFYRKDISYLRMSRALDKDSVGNFYLGDDFGRVFKFKKFGDGVPEQTFSNPAINDTVVSISIDGSNNLFVKTPTRSVFKFLANGTLDYSFGVNGAVSLIGTSSSAANCGNDHVKVIGDFVFVTDSCNGAIIKLSRTSGAVISEFNLPVNEIGYISKSSTSGNLLISLERPNQNATILQVNNSTFETVNTVTINSNSTPLLITGIATTTSHWFILSQNRAAVLVIDPASGNVVGEWNGVSSYDETIPTPGKFGLVVGDVLALDDGTFVALDSSEAAVHRLCWQHNNYFANVLKEGDDYDDDEDVRGSMLDLFTKHSVLDMVLDGLSTNTNWTMEAVIAGAVSQNEFNLLKYLMHTGININEIARSHCLQILVNDIPSKMSVWLLEHANVILTGNDVTTLTFKCLARSRYDIIMKLINDHHLTMALVGTTLLDAFDEWITNSTATLSEDCLCKSLNWLHKSKRLESIAIPAVNVLHGSGVADIDFSGLERLIAQGGDFKFSASIFTKHHHELPNFNKVFGIYLRAGFNTGVVDFINNCYLRGEFQPLQECVDVGVITTTMLGMGLFKALDEWSYSPAKITSDSIDIQDFSTQVFKRALKGRFLMLIARMLALGFFFNDVNGTVTMSIWELYGNTCEGELQEFFKKAGFIEDAVGDVKLGLFNFSAGLMSVPGQVVVPPVFSGNIGGRNTGIFASEKKAVGWGGSTRTLFSGSAPSMGYTRAGSGVASPKAMRLVAFGAAMRESGSRLMTGGHINITSSGGGTDHDYTDYDKKVVEYDSDDEDGDQFSESSDKNNKINPLEYLSWGSNKGANNNSDIYLTDLEGNRRPGQSSSVSKDPNFEIQHQQYVEKYPAIFEAKKTIMERNTSNSFHCLFVKEIVKVVDGLPEEDVYVQNFGFHIQKAAAQSDGGRGMGTFGKVWIGQNQKNEKYVAVKLVDKMNDSGQPILVKTIRQEVSNLINLKHPCIINIREFRETDLSMHLFLDLARNRDLMGLLLAKTKFTEYETRDIMIKLLSALKYLHSHDVVHSDLPG
ncbi:Serine/threonine-protein kinase 32A [Blyttiomyces sp. JEL0837]|nr:Serine/threonine-protein kinase 32A [Blyttiomyces sp. JEL0837]